MAASTDYDAPRRVTTESGEDALETLPARRGPQVPVVDAEETETFELPGADLPDEELTVPVVPMLADEFRCPRCFLVRHRSQLAGEVCRDCS